jgi:hypothetical protein
MPLPGYLDMECAVNEAVVTAEIHCAVIEREQIDDYAISYSATEARDKAIAVRELFYKLIEGAAE